MSKEFFESENFGKEEQAVFEENKRKIRELMEWVRLEESNIEVKRRRESREIIDSKLTSEEKQKMLKDAVVSAEKESFLLQQEYERRTQEALKEMKEGFLLITEEKKVKAAANNFPDKEFQQIIADQREKIGLHTDAEINRDLDELWENRNKSAKKPDENIK